MAKIIIDGTKIMDVFATVDPAQPCPVCQYEYWRLRPLDDYPLCCRCYPDPLGKDAGQHISTPVPDTPSRVVSGSQQPMPQPAAPFGAARPKRE